MKKYRGVRFLLVFAILISMVCFNSVTVSAATGTAPQQGTGTLADPYIIDEPLELVWMGENYSTIRSKYFQQTADIDMSSVANFTPIGNGTTSSWGDEFSGQYEGLGFQISNLTINSDLAYMGLFQYVSGTVKNLTLDAVNMTATGTYAYIGIGGIAGYSDNVTISNCGISGYLSVTGIADSSNIGGICGQCSGTTKITNCYCTATLTNSNANASIGGIAGYTVYAGLSVDHCYFAGAIIGGNYAQGAIIGNDYLGTYTNNVYLDTTSSFGLGYTKTDAGCTRATVASIKTTAPYLAQGWDFTSVWKMDAVTDYPTFIIAPGVPTNVKAQPGNGQIIVNWNAAAYASKYNIYYGTTSGVYGAPISVSGTSATIPGLTNLTNYYICVKALHGSVEGAASSVVTCVPHVIISDLTAAGSVSSVVITFSAPTGASTVELQQSTNGGTSYSAVAGVPLTSTSTGVTLTGMAGGIYIYRLKLTFSGVDANSNLATAQVGGSYTKGASVFSAEYDENIVLPDDYLYIGNDFGELDDAALQFDLSDCAGSVKNAYLYVYVYPSWSSGSAVLNLYGHNNDSWSSSVMPADPNGSNSSLIQSGITDFKDEKYIRVPVTDFIKSQLAAGDKIISLYLAGQATSVSNADYVCLCSPQSIINKPYLDIEFTNDNANLSGIKVNGTSLPGFLASTNTYSYTAPHDSVLSALSFTSTLEDSSASQGAWAYNSASHSWSVTVTAPDGTTKKTYTVNVSAAAQSSDAALSSISIGDTPLTGFTSSTLDYAYPVPHGTNPELLSLTSVVHDHNGKQGSWFYDVATHTWRMTVTSEDSLFTKTYTVTINELPSTDATLKSIKVNGIDVDSFTAGTQSYECKVAHGTVITAASFSSAANDANATIGNWTESAAPGKWSVTVTAQDKTTTLTYEVTINELPNTDAALTGIKISGTAINGFVSSKYDYSFDVVHGTDLSALAHTSTFSDHMATGTWSYDSVNYNWSITVTAEDTTTKRIYTVTINELRSTDATLKSIETGGTDLAGFSSSTLSYKYSVLYGTDISKLVFTSEKNDHMAAMGAWTYDAANKSWSVTVTAEDTSKTKTYTVAVTEYSLPQTGTLGDYRSNTLSYQGHVQDFGWQGAVANSFICGTTGQSKRLEAINILLNNIPGGIEYCTHVQDIGWMDWVTDGAMSGTSGQSKRLEAIRIRLTGEAAEKYDIYYRVHSQNFGWMDWAKNGEAAGTAGYSYRMEAVEIVMVIKGDPAPGATNRIFSQAYK